MKETGRIALAAVAALLFGGLAVQAAPYFYWNGSVSTNWHEEGNWTIDRRGATTTNLIPEIGDVAYINATPGNLPTLSTVQSALVFRVAYSSGTTGLVNIVEGADLFSIAYNSRVGNSGGGGMINQSGGDIVLHSLTLGNSSGSVGTYNLSGGTMRMVTSGTVGGIADISLGVANIGTGTFNLSGGTVETLRGVSLSGVNDGVGIFNVLGGGIVNIGSVDVAAAGFWYQGAEATLRATIDSDTGFSLGQINVIDGSNETPYVTFQFGAELDVGFSGADMGDVTNTWDLMTWPTNTVVTDNGLAFSTNVDLDDWSFVVANTGLQVTYGIGSDPVVVTNPPPTGPRTLYWTGNGADMNATNGANWDLDFSGTNVASWGVYEGDTIYVGHNSLNDTGFVSEATYDGGAPFPGQNSLYIGRGRTGIFNFNSGELRFLSNNTRKRHFIGFNAAGGDGTLNVNGGELWIYATELGELSGTEGTLNINGGDLVLSGRSYSSRGSDGDYATLWVGSNGATGDVNIASGSLRTLIGVVLGDNGGTGTFKVDGSGASQIGIGAYRADFDGYWVQNANSTLQVVIDDTATGVTPIEIIETGQANTPTLAQYGADVVFKAGSILDVSWAAGVTNFGTFDVMTFDGGSLADLGLAFSTNVDQDVWSFQFVDTNGDFMNDTLRVSSLPFAITAIHPVGSDVDMTWRSLPRYKYTVESNTDLMTTDWTEVPPFIDLVATGSSITVSIPVTNLTESAESFRVTRDLPDPPAAFLEEDFEGDSATNWVVTGTGSVWERGEPNVDNGFVTITNAASGMNCYATSINSPYADDTDTRLTSPAFVLGTSSVVVVWAEAYDIEDDIATVSVIDEDAGTTNTVETRTILDGQVNGWTTRSQPLPLTPAGQTVRIEFQFQAAGAHDGGYVGWYIDDVVVKEQL